MRRLLSTLIAVLCLFAAPTTVVAEVGALLYCDSLVYDFGTIDRRVEEVYHTFHIENRGDEPLIIKRVERSCSCMRAVISKRPIAPGDSRDMRVVYDVRKMPEGIFSKVVQIYSNSRDTGFEQFTIMGRSVSNHRRERRGE